MLRNSPITWYVNQCAARLRARTGHDVRVIPSDLFPAWRTSGEQARDRGEPLRSDIHRAKLHEADFVFIVWFLGMHYSLLVLCHPGTSGQAYVFNLTLVLALWQYTRAQCPGMQADYWRTPPQGPQHCYTWTQRHREAPPMIAVRCILRSVCGSQGCATCNWNKSNAD